MAKVNEKGRVVQMLDSVPKCNAAIQRRYSRDLVGMLVVYEMTSAMMLAVFA